MHSGSIRALTVSVALSLTSGCMFTQWTDHAFFGIDQDPPTHHNHEWVGAVVLPLAIVGDIVTAPAQVIALMVVGDFGIYRGSQGRVSMGPADLRPMRVAGVDARGNVTELSLSDDQKTRLAARLEVGSYGGASEVSTN